MIKAFTGKTYTADRENLWRKMDFKGFNTIAEYSASNRITKQKTAFLPISDWADNLLFAGFEDFGDYIRDTDLVLGSFSWLIDPETDYHFIAPGGGTVYGKRNLTTDAPHLKFISDSSRYASIGALTGKTITSLMVYFYITPLAVDKVQYVLCREGTFSIYIDATNHVVFTVSDGTDTYSITSSGTVSLRTESRVVCQYTLSPSAAVSVEVNDTITSATDNTITINDAAENTKNLFIGCKPESGGTVLSSYLDACIHTLAIRNGTLTTDQIGLIDNSIDPVGVETIKYIYDNAAGDATGIPNALKRIEQKFPFFETIKILNKNTTGKIEESDA